MFKVMIVDDEYDIRKGLKKLINWEEQGFTIIGEAKDGDEALEMYKRKKPHLVITDIKMPGMNGLELARQIRETSLTSRIIILSGYDDFSYAREAINHDVVSYLLKPIDTDEFCDELVKVRNSLHTELASLYEKRKIAEWLKNYFFRKLVRGEALQTDDFDNDRWEEMKKRNNFTVLLVELNGFRDTQLQPSESEALLKQFAVRNILEEIIGSTNGGILYEESDHQFGILLANDSVQLSKATVQSMTKQMVDYIQRFAKQSILIGVGHTVETPGQISQSYWKASSALGKSFFHSNQHVFYYDEVNMALSAWSLKWTAKELSRAVRQLNRIKVTYQLDILFQELSEKDAPIETIRDVFVYTLVELSRIVIEAEGDWNQMYQDHFSESDQLKTLRTSKEARAKLIEICNGMIESIMNKRNYPVQNNMKEIIRYIEKYYWKDLNLKKLADIFYVSSAYLGQLFKQETGQYFNDYFNQVRINEAKQLLLNDHLSITEISEKVGYKNTNHLYIHFKKITNLNPGDYRKQHMKV